ncbi:Aldehyde dehydrogenase, dimeric NADP-preferring [Candida viswanathii]|jgi:aldehyde dehydrogenase (NAD+)/aldehyde dehydrogenase (NAD(P)+)|uniref:Aldehyde dehydrogenase n=1 Tax=Candida viswanathii TaxID=5486 RepID=A0A367Y4G4_9ASCO|nr:Aldehyde dehydrogenase, dimeric NADP-preferring [Candida viswanathii]
MSPPSKLEDSSSSNTAADTLGDSWYTKVSDIAPGVQRLTESFHRDQKTHDIQFRLNQLRNLYFAVQDNADALCAALDKDFYRPPSETKNLELVGGLIELVHTMSSLHEWMKPEKVTDLPLTLKSNPIYIERIPLGVVLIISPFNYPFFLSFSAVVGAIAGGNAVVLKGSELTPNFSSLFTKILTKALDPDIFFAVDGGIPETTELLEQKFDKIMYTGNNTVGKIVAKKAAETLTPVILELGGKSPAFILDDVKDNDLEVIARRIAWGRFTNAGQTCVAVDYVLVPSKLHKKFIDALTKVLSQEFYPNLTKDTKGYTHVIHDRAFNNLSKIISTTKGDIVFGGETDAATRFIAPTVIDNATWEDSSMKGEIFGPILPVLTYDKLTTAIRQVVSTHDTPLAQYIFTSGSTSRKYNRQLDQILTGVRSGGVIVNDVLMHVALINAPFGGVGDSGYGSYHGKFSFRSFTHERTTMEQKLWNDGLVKVRYPPYNSNKDKLIQVSQQNYNGKVWFDRKGDVPVRGPGALFSAWTTFTGVFHLLGEFITNKQ